MKNKKLKAIRAYFKWLKVNGLTVVLFAKQIGVGLNTVYKWGKNGRLPLAIFMEKIRAVYPQCPLLPENWRD